MGRHSKPETGDGVNGGRNKPTKIKCRVLSAEGTTDWSQTSEIFGSGPAKPKKPAHRQPRGKQIRRKNPWD